MNFDIKGNYRIKTQGLLGLSQAIYMNKVLEEFKIEKCFASVVAIQKGDRFNFN